MKIERLAVSALALMIPLVNCNISSQNNKGVITTAPGDVNIQLKFDFDEKKRRLQPADGGGQQGQGQQGGQQGGQQNQGGQQGQGPEGQQNQGGQQGGQQNQGPEGQQNNQNNNQGHEGPEGQNQQGQQGQQQQGPEGQNQQNNQNQQNQGPNQQQQQNQQGQQNNQQQQGPEQQNNQNQQNQGPNQQQQQNQQNNQNQQQQNQQQQDKEQQEREQQEKEQQEREQQEKEQREGQVDCVKYPWRCPMPTPAPSPYQAHPDYLRPTLKPSQLFATSPNTSPSTNLVSNTNLAQDAEIGFVIGVGVVVAALFFGIALVAYRAKVHVGVARRVRNYLHNRDGGESMSVLEVALAMLEGNDVKPHRNFDASGHSQDGLTDSYNNRVPFGTAIDVSIRDSQRGNSTANYYPQYPSQHPPSQSPLQQPNPFAYPYGSTHTPQSIPRPPMTGPGMVPYGTPTHSMPMDSGRKPSPVIKPAVSQVDKKHDF